MKLGPTINRKRSHVLRHHTKTRTHVFKILNTTIPSGKKTANLHGLKYVYKTKVYYLVISLPLRENQISNIARLG
jgi:hypothetical protein